MNMISSADNFYIVLSLGSARRRNIPANRVVLGEAEGDVFNARTFHSGVEKEKDYRSPAVDEGVLLFLGAADRAMVRTHIHQKRA